MPYFFLLLPQAQMLCLHTWLAIVQKKSSAGGLGSLSSFVTVLLSESGKTISLFSTVSLGKICGPCQHNVTSGLCCLREGPSEIVSRVGTYLYNFCLSVLKAS